MSDVAGGLGMTGGPDVPPFAVPSAASGPAAPRPTPASAPTPSKRCSTPPGSGREPASSTWAARSPPSPGSAGSPAPADGFLGVECSEVFWQHLSGAEEWWAGAEQGIGATGQV